LFGDIQGALFLGDNPKTASRTTSDNLQSSQQSNSSTLKSQHLEHSLNQPDTQSHIYIEKIHLVDIRLYKCFVL